MQLPVHCDAHCGSVEQFTTARWRTQALELPHGCNDKQMLSPQARRQSQPPRSPESKDHRMNNAIPAVQPISYRSPSSLSVGHRNNTTHNRR